MRGADPGGGWPSMPGQVKLRRFIWTAGVIMSIHLSSSSSLLIFCARSLTEELNVEIIKRRVADGDEGRKARTERRRHFGGRTGEERRGEVRSGGAVVGKIYGAGVQCPSGPVTLHEISTSKQPRPSSPLIPCIFVNHNHISKLDIQNYLN